MKRFIIRLTFGDGRLPYLDVGLLQWAGTSSVNTPRRCSSSSPDASSPPAAALLLSSCSPPLLFTYRLLSFFTSPALSSSPPLLSFFTSQDLPHRRRHRPRPAVHRPQGVLLATSACYASYLLLATLATLATLAICYAYCLLLATCY